MYRAILLLHFYREEKYLGQKLHWVELESSRALAVLIDLLSQARQAEDYRGDEIFSTESLAYKSVRQALGAAYDTSYSVARLEPDLRTEATSVRVMQVTEGWPFDKPVIFYGQ